MRSASRMVPTRWATTILVDPAVSLRSACLRSLSVLESRAENVSSNRYIGGSLQMALAIASLCFCPPERFHPCCDMSESSPSGKRVAMPPSWAISIARSASSVVRSASPKQTLSLRVPPKITAVWGTYPIILFSSSSRYSRTSRPPT